MKTIIAGHRYELENFEAKDKPGQIIQFIQKEPDGDGIVAAGPDAEIGKLVTVSDGTTNEELLKVLINRMNSMQAKFPCRENAIATTHFETGLLWLQARTADRIARGVEGKHVK